MSASVRPWLAILLAAAAGPILDAGFPDRGWWPATFFGIAVVLVALRGQKWGWALLIGFVAGFSFYLTHIEWATLFLGVVPWIALSFLESLFYAVGATAIALAYRWVPRAWPGRLGRIALVPLVVAGIWTAREAIAAVWPYGGFAWGRVALSQSESPFADLFGWLGVSGVSFVMVLLMAFTVELWQYRAMLPRFRAVLAVASIAAVLAIPGWPTLTSGTMRVAAVQGDTKSGYFDKREYQGEILQGHLDATQAVVGQKVDAVIWPEGASDLSPLESSAAASAFDQVTSIIGAPLISGAITDREGKTFNSSLLWMPNVGITDIYDKKHPIPFGEYVPDRSFWRPFAPDLIDLIGRDYTPGTNDEVFDLGKIIVGVNICFDISDDQILTESVEDGAQIIFAQSNNADFGRTDESAQQLAIARIRAIETGRTVVNISTVAGSAIVAPNGSTIDSLPWYTPDVMIDTVPLSTAITPAVFLGRQVEWLVSSFGLLSVVLGGVVVRLQRKKRTA